MGLYPQSGWGRVTGFSHWVGWPHTTQQPLMQHANAVGRLTLAAPSWRKGETELTKHGNAQDPGDTFPSS